MLGCLVVSAMSAVPADARTVVRTYSPITADGTLRDALVVERGGTSAECTSPSFVAYRAVRCFAGSMIRDPCFIDTRRAADAVLCVSSPWSKVAISYEVFGELPETSGPDVTPWALRLESGLRCQFVSGATATIGSFRLNYFCSRPGSRKLAAVLYGSPNRTRATWTIRQARSVESRRLRRVSIRTAWR